MQKLNALIDEGSEFCGNLTFSGEARISGKINGTIYSSDSIVITENAIVNADVSADIIIISGTVKGNLKASSRVEIKKPAKFEGSIVSPSLAVEEGVIFHGLTQMKE